MEIAVIGAGHVGAALAGALLRVGHRVSVAARDVASGTVTSALAAHPGLTALPLREAVERAEVVFLATPFEANEAALKAAGSLRGKVLVDCTNPVGPGLTHGLGNVRSGGEHVQGLVPEARVVKAFTIYGYENFQDPGYPGYGDLRPAMLMAGDDADAKATVAGLCGAMGWEPVDVGGIAMSLHLEHMTLLWIQMARVQGRGPGFVWAMLRR